MDAMARFNKEAIYTIYRLIQDDKDTSPLQTVFINAVHLINDDRGGAHTSPGELLASHAQSDGKNSRIPDFVENVLTAVECPEKAKGVMTRLLSHLLEMSYSPEVSVTAEPSKPAPLEVPADTVNHKFGPNFG